VLNQPAVILAYSAPVGMQGFISLAFYADPLGLEVCGQIVYSKFIQAGYMLDVVTPLGPYMLMEIHNSGVGATASFMLAQTAQTPGGCLGGVNTGIVGRALCYFPNTSIGANSSLTVVPYLTIPGPAILTCRGSGAVFEARLTLSAGVESGSVFAGVVTTATNPSWATQQIVIPNDDWELTILNNSAGPVNGLANVFTLR
jgi:hypothetical protein